MSQNVLIQTPFSRYYFWKIKDLKKDKSLNNNKIANLIETNWRKLPSEKQSKYNCYFHNEEICRCLLPIVSHETMTFDKLLLKWKTKHHDRYRYWCKTHEIEMCHCMH